MESNYSPHICEFKIQSTFIIIYLTHRLLTRHPNVGKLFPFGKENLSYEQLLKHAQVQAHGKKVMEKVGDAVDGLDDLDLLVPILKELGGRHVGYGVNKQLFEVLPLLSGVISLSISARVA